MAGEGAVSHPLNSRLLPSSRVPAALVVAVKVMSTPGGAGAVRQLPLLPPSLPLPLPPLPLL